MAFADQYFIGRIETFASGEVFALYLELKGEVSSEGGTFCPKGGSTMSRNKKPGLVVRG
jgi:hypothetical protein